MQEKSLESIIDVNVHLAKSAYGPQQSAGALLRSMDKSGVQISLVSCFTPPDLSFERGNREIDSAVREHPTRLRGLVRVDPRQYGSRNVLKKFLQKKSFVGISLNPFEQSFKVNDPLVRPVYELAEESDSPVMLESGYPVVSLPLQIAEVAREFRKVDFIMTHAGQLLASGQSEADSFRAVVDYPNIYCETSQIILSGVGSFIEQVMHSRKNGSKHRIMFGSNAPQGELSVELMRVTEAAISDNEKRLVLSKNGKKLFKL
ncbi:MAG TPA: amidohydrolase family protein [Nitrososphaerales archaeon]|nr:amidohydrolase family protein [Nitrososphaerales archaeon]